MKTSIFPQVCRQSGIPEPVAEFHFHPTRRFRFDWAWIDHKVALEVEGGIWSGGHHARGKGITRDILKYNEAAALGWIVLRCQPRELLSVATINYVRSAIATRKAA